MRFHNLQNVQTALNYMRYRKVRTWLTAEPSAMLLTRMPFVVCSTQIKVVNIRAEDIVDSNPKLTLGLIWTIILHFQVSSSPLRWIVFALCPIWPRRCRRGPISIFMAHRWLAFVSATGSTPTSSRRRRHRDALSFP